MSESVLVGLSWKQIQLQPYKVRFEWYHIQWQMNRAPGHCGGKTACIMGLEGHIWLTSFWKRATALNSRWRIKREKQRDRFSIQPCCSFPMWWIKSLPLLFTYSQWLYYWGMFDSAKWWKGFMTEFGPHMHMDAYRNKKMWPPTCKTERSQKQHGTRVCFYVRNNV